MIAGRAEDAQPEFGKKKVEFWDDVKNVLARHLAFKEIAAILGIFQFVFSFNPKIVNNGSRSFSADVYDDVEWHPCAHEFFSGNYFYQFLEKLVNFFG